MSEIKVDTVAEKTSANGVTVDGLNIKDSKLVTANSIVTANITDGAISAAKLASGVGGKVLQVVNAHTGTQVTSNSATYADTGLTAAITPSATSSKILVLVQQSVGKSGGDTKGNIRVYRGSTEIGGAVAGRQIGDTDSSATNIVGTGFANSFLDTPSSTSSLTYKTQFNNADAAGTIAVQYGSSQSYMTLMEIAG